MNFSPFMEFIADVCLFGLAGYCCYYLDRQRRNDLNLMKKRRERLWQRLMVDKRPGFLNQKPLQRYFTRELQLGEELISQGNLEDGVDHFSNAVMVCEQQEDLEEFFQHTLPSETFAMLVNSLQNKGYTKTTFHASFRIMIHHCRRNDQLLSRISMTSMTWSEKKRMK